MKCVLDDGTVLAREVESARGFFKRLKGLMFRPSMARDTALLLSPCPQIHTCFMRFPIDVLFLDENGVVLHVKENMKPWRVSPVVLRAVQTLEFPGGTFRGRIRPGRRVDFK